MSFVGVSPADFYLLARFTHRVISALKEEGGSRSQYQEAVSSLESLAKALQQLHDLRTADGTAILGDGTRSNVHQGTSLISNFVEKIAEYEEVLGKTGPKGFTKGLVQKERWALKTAGHLTSFRESLDHQLQNLGLDLSKEIL